MNRGRRGRGGVPERGVSSRSAKLAEKKKKKKKKKKNNQKVTKDDAQTSKSTT